MIQLPPPLYRIKPPWTAGWSGLVHIRSKVDETPRAERAALHTETEILDGLDAIQRYKETTFLLVPPDREWAKQTFPAPTPDDPLYEEFYEPTDGWPVSYVHHTLLGRVPHITDISNELIDQIITIVAPQLLQHEELPELRHQIFLSWLYTQTDSNPKIILDAVGLCAIENPTDAIKQRCIELIEYCHHNRPAIPPDGWHFPFNLAHVIGRDSLPLLDKIILEQNGSDPYMFAERIRAIIADKVD